MAPKKASAKSAAKQGAKKSARQPGLRFPQETFYSTAEVLQTLRGSARQPRLYSAKCAVVLSTRSQAFSRRVCGRPQS